MPGSRPRTAAPEGARPALGNRHQPSDGLYYTRFASNAYMTIGYTTFRRYAALRKPNSLSEPGSGCAPLATMALIRPPSPHAWLASCLWCGRSSPTARNTVDAWLIKEMERAACETQPPALSTIL